LSSIGLATTIGFVQTKQTQENDAKATNLSTTGAQNNPYFKDNTSQRYNAFCFWRKQKSLFSF
jgi:hypothetical protein